MEEVRRPDDDELCGSVDADGEVWRARTVFGAELGRHGDRESAVEQVLREGLASLADRWTLHDGRTGDEEIVCILEAHPGRVTVALGYYSLPGVPTLEITVDQLTTGRWELRR